MTTSHPLHYGIVGGGLLGLTLALRLIQRGQQITLLEAADQVGGLASAWQLGDFTWDRHYHVTLLSDSHLRGILQELGLDSQIRWVHTRTGFLAAGRLFSLSNIGDFLRFPLLGATHKLRLVYTIRRAAGMHDWQALEHVPVGDWLKRYSGRYTFDRLWLPLLRAKLGEAWQRTSAVFIWATIQRMYAARRTGLKREMFGYVPGGYARILDTFRDRLEELGVCIRTGCRVQRIEHVPQRGLAVTDAAGRESHFDRVIVTSPAPIAARMCPQFSREEIERLRGVEYLGILCASLVLRKPLGGYYVTNILDPSPFTGVIEMTALVDPAEFGGRTLVYLPKYCLADDPSWLRSDAEIRDEFLAAMDRLYPGFLRDDVLGFRLSRVKHVFALPTLGYSERVPRVETSVPGLFVVNSAQILQGTLNVNETVRLAESSLGLVHREPLRTQRTDVHTGEAPRPKQLASLSLDLDNKWSYLKTRGDARWTALPSYLDTVVPRFLSVLQDLGLQATVFVVGQDAALGANRAALESVVAEGHEIGNHSFHHDPWLHLYSHEQVEEELTAAEEAIAQSTGVQPRGFRGPGYSLSPHVLASLARRGYQYDATTLPTFLGPLARQYYLLTAELDHKTRKERARLFGTWSEGLRPVRAYWWEFDAEAIVSADAPSRLLEIPVTTMPLLRTPFHLSYLLYLRQYSASLAWTYWRLAMRLCSLRGVPPSLLLHPLDFLGGEDEPELTFFPAMSLPSQTKVDFVRAVLEDYAAQYDVVSILEHAESLKQTAKLPVHRVDSTQIITSSAHLTCDPVN